MSVENNNPAGEAGELAETDWLAFAYVAGELDGRELEEWTSRLADGEVEACESVAAAVELVQSMSNTPSNTPSVATDAVPGHMSGRDSRWRFVAAAALCLSLVVVLSWQSSHQPAGKLAGDEMVVSVAMDDDVLLSSWTDGTAPEDVEGGEESAVMGGEPLVAETDLVVPEWMLVAVALSSETIEGEDK